MQADRPPNTLQQNRPKVAVVARFALRFRVA
jgi:hypothetical protein